MKRKSDGTPARNDSVKDGCGIDGSEGQNFTKKSQNPWTQQSDHDEQPSYAGRYTDNNSGLRQKLPEEVRAGNNQAGVGRDIFDAVEANQPDDTNRGLKPRGGQS